MLKKIFLAAFLMAMLVFTQNVSAEEVEVYNNENSRTTYCVDTSSIRNTGHDSSSFTVRVVTYEKTYSPQEDFYYFVKEGGEILYTLGEGGSMNKVSRGDEPAYSIYKYCSQYLKDHHHPINDDDYFTGG
ncbi:MAG: hypothetical protein IKZ58_00865 [Selenomonadaceae bacterium]|nr:hypothetical protein [Selenomonadaceae bacterium]